MLSVTNKKLWPTQALHELSEKPSRFTAIVIAMNDRMMGHISRSQAVFRAKSAMSWNRAGLITKYSYLRSKIDFLPVWSELESSEIVLKVGSGVGELYEVVLVLWWMLLAASSHAPRPFPYTTTHTLMTSETRLVSTSTISLSYYRRNMRYSDVD